jgi:hypothetical protein
MAVFCHYRLNLLFDVSGGRSRFGTFCGAVRHVVCLFWDAEVGTEVPLNDTTVRRAQPREKPYNKANARDLQFLAISSDTKLQMKYPIRRTRKEAEIGKIWAVFFRDARDPPHTLHEPDFVPMNEYIQSNSGE